MHARFRANLFMTTELLAFLWPREDHKRVEWIPDGAFRMGLS
jgi:hypothetical protein